MGYILATPVKHGNCLIQKSTKMSSNPTSKQVSIVPNEIKKPSTFENNPDFPTKFLSKPPMVRCLTCLLLDSKKWKFLVQLTQLLSIFHYVYRTTLTILSMPSVRQGSILISIDYYLLGFRTTAKKLDGRLICVVASTQRMPIHPHSTHLKLETW